MARFEFVVIALCFFSESVVCKEVTSTLSEEAPSPGYDLYCVVPGRNVPCPPECESRCSDLHFYISANDYFESNTKFVFINGTHPHTTDFTATNITNLTFTTPNSMNKVVVQCSQDDQVGFVFSNCSQIIIRNIAFVNCGQEFHTPRNQTSRAALAFLGGSHLILDSIVVSDSSVQGLYVSQVQSLISISESKFVKAGYRQNHTNMDSNIAGNSIFAELSNITRGSIAITSLCIQIRNSEFLDNSNRPDCVEENDAYEYCKCDHLASGLAIILRRPNVSVELSGLTFNKNSGCRGGNLAVVFNTSHPFIGDVTIQDCLIKNGNATFGGGLYVFYLSAPKAVANNHCGLEVDTKSNYGIAIENTTIEHNTALVGGGMYAGLTESLAICSPFHISVTNNCLFQRNALSYAGYGGVAIHNVNFISFEYKKQILPQFLLIIRESKFRDHYFSPQHSKWNNSGSGVLYVKTNHHVAIENIEVYDNMYSGVVIVDSSLIVSGSVEIYNNGGSSGGGMLFCSNSVMFLTPNTTINISNNRVIHAGGGICVEDQCLQSKPFCVFQPDYTASIHPELDRTINIHLFNNSADYAGDQIYGGSIDYCYIMNSPFHNVSTHEADSVQSFKQMFTIVPNETSSITSPQRRVCLCYETHGGMEPDCAINKTIQKSVYPGEPFKFLAAVVGQLNGTVPGTVYTDLKRLNDLKVRQRLAQDGEVQKSFGKGCTELSYTIHTNSNRSTLVLSVQFIGDKSFTEHLTFFKPLEVEIGIKKCPLGFSLHNESNCSCLLQLQNGFHCYISNKTIVPKHGFWIGVSSKILYSNGCTLDYCKNTHFDQKAGIQSEQADFSNLDNQCDFHRTGILCGACPENYSVILGSSHCCDDCSDASLLLIPLFAIMGLFLVVFLMALNMTVTEGTMSGLLFYANIVQISNKVFFRGNSIYILTRFLKGFIAWLNLDFGISTCLYRGMDDYAKAWLQFVFPLYIWLITGVIIYLSRRLTFVARLVKRNGVKVLATLVLLAYAKILRASIEAIHFMELQHLDPDGHHDSVTLCWYSDCNIQYMKHKHIPLGIIGFILILCLFPLAFLLLLSDLLNKVPFFSWMWRIKPFLDAYTGPYTNEGRYWTGLLLVVRCALFAASTFNHSTGITSLNVTLANIIVVFLLILPWLLRTGIYCKRWLNVLECSFLLNLGVLTTGTQYLFYYRKRQEWLTHLSIGFAFITFIVIVLYHICQFKSVEQICSKLKKVCYRRRNTAPFETVDVSGTFNNTQSDSDEDLLSQFPPLVQFDQDREPLLYESTD